MKNRNINNGEILLEFGDYVTIEQKRYGCKNEQYLCKVIGTQKSNHYVKVPVEAPAKESINEITNTVSCIVCGVNEIQVLNYRIEDVKLYSRSDWHKLKKVINKIKAECIKNENLDWQDKEKIEYTNIHWIEKLEKELGLDEE